MANERAQRWALEGPVQGGRAECWRLGVQVTLHEHRRMGKIGGKVIWLIKYYSARKMQ